MLRNWYELIPQKKNCTALQAVIVLAQNVVSLEASDL